MPNSDILRLLSMLLADVINDQDLSMDKKMRLIDDLAISIKKYVRSHYHA